MNLGRRKGQRQRIRKYKGNMKMKLGELCLDKAGKGKAVFLKHHSVHFFVTRMYWHLLCTRLQVLGAAALTGKHTSRVMFTDSLGNHEENPWML